MDQKTNSEKKKIEKFEDALGIIDTLLEKKSRSWKLKAVNWFDYEDVKQKIRFHIFIKWDKWDRQRPIEPWLNTIISNQIINEIRNNYKSFQRPCLDCKHKECSGTCLISPNGIQGSFCEEYSRWEKRGKRACDVKLPLPIQNHYKDLSKSSIQNDNNFDLDTSADNLHKEMKKVLSIKQYNLYKMLFIDKIDEDTLAAMMHWKTNEKGRKAGYKQIRALKKMFFQIAQKIIQDKDIIL